MTVVAVDAISPLTGGALIRMGHVPAIDSTAIHALRDLVRRTRRDGTVVFFSDVQAQPLLALRQSELLDEIGGGNLFGDVDKALIAARAHLGLIPEEPTITS